MLFRDTGQFVYEVVTDDVYEGFYKDRGLFDFSNYPRDSKFFDPINKKVIGKIKEWHARMTLKLVKRSKFFTPNFGLMVSAAGCNCYVLFNKKIVKTKVKKIQIQFHKIATYEVC